MNEKKYYPGIDVLRFLSMMFIVTIHTLRHGNVLSRVEFQTSNYLMAYSLLAIVNVGVDVFALISGFVGYRDEIRCVKWKNFFSQWLIVLFYSMGFMICFSIVDGSFSAKNILLSATPVTSQTYWYFTSYFFVFLLAPYMNYIVVSNTKKQSFFTLFGGMGALYLSHRIEGLFSITLLLYLYIVGAMIRKYEIYEAISEKIIKSLMILSTLFMISWEMVLSTYSTKIAEICLGYDSPFLIIVSVGWILLFARMKGFNARQIKYIHFFAPSVFSVYLINDNPSIRSRIVCNIIPECAFNNPWILFNAILISTLLFFIAGLFIDLLRRFLFKKFKI